MRAPVWRSRDLRLGRFTIKSQEALQEAQRMAREHSHQEVDGEHLLLATKLLVGEFKPGDRIKVVARNGAVEFEKK